MPIDLILHIPGGLVLIALQIRLTLSSQTPGGLVLAASQIAKGDQTPLCQMMGYSRDSFYRFKELYESGGEVGRKPVTQA